MAYRGRKFCNSKSILAMAIAAAVGVGSLARQVAANLLYWDPTNTPSSPVGGAGTWDTTTTSDWSNLSVDGQWTDTTGTTTAIFGGASSTVTLVSNETANGVQFNTSGYLLTGGTLTLAQAGGSPTPTITSYGNDAISSVIAGSAGVTISGTGTLGLNGTTAETLTGGVAVSGGTLLMDFSNMGTSPGNMINSGNALSLGGTLSIMANSNGTTSQTFNGVTLTPGASAIVINTNSGAGVSLTLGAITRTTAGGTIDFSNAANTTIMTTTGNTNGIIGGYATYGGTTWAINNGSNVIAGLANGAYLETSVGGGTSSNYTNQNVDVDTTTTVLNPGTPNSLRFSANAANTFGWYASSGDILESGGILVAGSVGAFASTVSAGGSGNGSFTSGTGDVVVIQNNTNAAGSLTISAAITNNGSTAVGLTKSGLGTLVLSGGEAASTFTGNIYANAGTILLNSTAGTSGTASNLGNASVAHSLTISNGANLTYGNNQVLANINYSGTIALSTVINAGGTMTNASGGFYNPVGPITLNGGTLTNLGGGTAAEQAWEFYGPPATAVVTVGGNSPSTITGSGTSDGIALNGYTSTTNIFNIGSTGSTQPDLTINVSIVNPDGPNLAAGGITKTGPGVLALNASNTFTGVTLVSAGTLLLQNGNALSGSTFDTSGAGTLSFGTLTAAAFGGLQATGGTGTLTLANANNTAVALSVGQASTGGFNSTFSGSLAGPSGSSLLVAQNNGSLTLSGNNSNFLGSVTVTGANSEHLILNSTSALSSANSVSFTGTFESLALGANVTLQSLSGTTNTTNTISGTGFTLTLAPSATTATTYAGTIQVPIILNGDAAGTQTLSANNAITSTTITSGVLRSTSVGALGGAAADVVTMNGGKWGLAAGTNGTFTYANNVVVTANSIIVSDDLANGAGSTGILGTLGISGQTLTLAGGLKVTGGTAGITFGATTFSTANPIFIVNNPTGGGATQVSLGAVINNAFTAIINGDGSVIQTGVWGNGSGGIIYKGTGTLTMNQANTYTGGTTIDSGTVLIGISNATGSGALGPVADTITLGNGSGSANASLLTNGSIAFSNPITVASGSSGNTLTIGGNSNVASSFSGLITLNNPVTISQSGGATLTVSGGIAANGNAITANAGSSSLIIIGTSAISGTKNSALNINGIGTVTLSGANTSFLGSVTINNIGTLNLTNIAALSSANAVSFTANGVLQIPTTETMASLGGTTGTVQPISSDISTLTLAPAASTSNTFGGAIINNNGTMSLTLNGSSTGTQVLSGASAYSGATSITAGTLVVANSTGSATGTSVVTVASGGTLADSSTGGGTITSQVNVNGGGDVSAFSGASLTISSNGVLKLDADSNAANPVVNFTLTGTPNGTSNPLINITGSGGLVVNSTGKTTINIAGGSTVTAGTYDLIGYSGTFTTFANFNSTVTGLVIPSSEGYALVNNTSGKQIDLTITSNLGVIATDNAAGYTTPAGNTGWTPGAPNGFGNWTQYNVGSGSGNVGENVGASGNINTGGQAWAMYANTSGDTADMRRNISASGTSNQLPVGQTFAFDFQNGSVSGGGQEGISFYSSSASALFEFYLAGGANDYTIHDNSGTPTTTIANTSTGLHIELTLTGANNYFLSVTPEAGGAATTYSGVLIGNAGTAITAFRAFDYEGQTGGNNGTYFFINSDNIYLPTYNGNAVGATAANFSTTANWAAHVSVNGGSVAFDGTGSTVTDDSAASGITSLYNILFNAGTAMAGGPNATTTTNAGSYTLQSTNFGATGLTLNGGITNSSSSLQTINFTGSNSVGITLGAAQTFNAGTGGLSFGNGASTGVNLNGSALTISGSANTTFSFTAPITDSGAGSLTYSGTGTLTLNASNSYAGTTSVSSGKLLVNGSTGAGNVTVSSGATLGGIGTVGGAVNVLGGGIISAASGSQLSLTNGLTLNSNTSTTSPIATFALAAPNGTSNALVNITGSLAANLSGSSGKSSISITGSPQAGTYDLFSYTTTGPNLANFTVGAQPNGFVGILQQGTLQIDLVEGQAITWTGQTNGNGVSNPSWDTTSTNWATAAPVATNYTDGSAVTFQDSNAITSSNVTSTTVSVQTAGVMPSTVIINNINVNYTFSNAGGGTIGIAGSTGITKNGTGTVTFDSTSVNTFTGAVAINAGVVNIQNGSALGSTSGTTVASGAALQIQGGITVGNLPLTISGAGAGGGTGALENVSGINTYGGLLALAAPATISSDSGTLNLTNTGTILGPTFGLTITGSGNVSLSSVIGTTSGSLTKSGSGTLTLNAASTYTGATNIISGVLQIAGANNILPPGLILEMGNNNGSPTTFDLNGQNQTIAALADNSPINSVDKITDTNSSASTLTINSSTTNSFSGVLSNGSGSLAVILNGSGTQILAGASTYSGLTMVNGGTLQVTNAASMGTGGFAVINNATLEATANITESRAFYLGNANSAIVVDSGKTYEIDGTINNYLANSGMLNFTGPGKLLLTNANTYTGGTNINSGILALSGSGALANGAITVAGGATLAPGHGTSAGNGGAGVGATLNLQAGSILNLDANTVGSFNLNQQGGWSPSTTALILGGASLNIDVGATSVDQVVVNLGNASVSGTNTIHIGQIPGLTSLTLNTYPLITLSGGGGGLTAADFTLGNPTIVVNGVTYNLSLINSASVESLQITGTAGASIWSGATDNTWATGSNWLSGTAPGTTTSTTNTDTATFNGAGNGHTTIVVDANRVIGNITFDTNAAAYTIGSGGANGNTLGLSNGGTIQIASTFGGSNNNAETFNTALALEGTSYTIANNATSSAVLNIAGNITGAAGITSTLTLGGSNTGNTNTISGILQNGSGGTLALTTSGTGTWALTNSNTYTGATTVNGGTLVLGAGMGTNPVIDHTSSLTINNGGTVQQGVQYNEFNNVTGLITINAGGTLMQGTVGGGQASNLVNLTIAGGTLAGSNPTTNFGSWYFDANSTITAGGVATTSTISAQNIDLNYSGAGSVTFNVLSGASNGVDLDVTGTFAQPWGNAGVLNKSGAGTMRLDSANSYTGGTNVAQGKLLVANSSGSATGPGSVIVSSGATLGGAGTIAGATTISGHAAPGANNTAGSNFGAAGTLNLQNGLTLSNGAVLDFDLANVTTAGSGVNDLIAVTGSNLSFNGGGVGGGTLNINVLGGDLANSVYTLITAPGISGSMGTWTVGTVTNAASGHNYSFSVVGGNAFDLTVTSAGGPAIIVATPVNGTTVNAGSTVQVANNGGNGADSAVLSSINVSTTGTNGTFTQSGLSTAPIAVGSSQTGTVGFTASNGGVALLNGLTATGTLSFTAADGGANGPASGAGPYSYPLAVTVTGNTGNGTANIGTGGTYGSVANPLYISRGSGQNTKVSFLGGTASTATTINVNFANIGTGPAMSDQATITGTGSDLHVIEMSYNPALLPAGSPANSVMLGWLNTSLTQPIFQAAFYGDSDHGATSHEILGAYNNADFVMGDYGLDTTNDQVWAVVNGTGTYEAVSRIPGDIDGDGTVDTKDFDIWFSHLGQSSHLYSLGDVNGDGNIDTKDFDIWFAHLGQSVIGGGASPQTILAEQQYAFDVLNGTNVPEPASLGVLALGAVGLLAPRKGKR